MVLGNVNASREELQSALMRWFLKVASQKPLLIAVDDIHRIDEASAALLVLLSDKARSHKLLIAVTHETDPGRTDSQAISVLLSRCSAIELEALHRSEEAELLRSVFGDVPNLGFVSDWVHEVSHGNPRTCMDLAQHLVDKQIVAYHGGSWTLPHGGEAIELPSGIEEVWRQRISRISPLAHRLAQTHALCLDEVLAREQYLQLAAPEHDARSVDQALNELISQQILVNTAEHYSLAHRGFRTSLTADIDARERARCHRRLSRLYASDGESADPAAAAREVHHLLAGEECARAIDRLAVMLGRHYEQPQLSTSANLSGRQIAELLERALDGALALGRDQRTVTHLRQSLLLAGSLSDLDIYYRIAPVVRAQLEHDSGLDLYRELSAVEDRSQRLGAALSRAAERYAATPEAQRGYRADEAIRQIAYYVVSSVMAGTNTFDDALLASLPELVEPFTTLSPLLAVMRENVVAAFDGLCACRFEEARAGWTRSFEQLSQPSVASLDHVSQIRDAIAYGVGALEARIGLLNSAARWAECLDRDPLQKTNALNLRRLIRLQQGDWEGAERLRKQIEVAAVHDSLQIVFNSLTVELTVAALADDLTALRQTANRIAKLAASWRGWVPFDLLAQGYFLHCCGDYEAAREVLGRCIALVPPQSGDPRRSIAAWPGATAAYIETLRALDRCEEARIYGERGLSTCEELGLGFASHPIARALALAEAQLGEHEKAAARLDAIALQQTTLGVSGVHLGATYDARARVAIGAGDKAAIEAYCTLTAQEYRHGDGSALGARYERLMDDARRAGVAVTPELSQFASTMMPSTHSSTRGSANIAVERVMRDAETKEERAQHALSLLCEKFGARAGYLYLCDNSGLHFAASHAAGPATEGVVALVRAELTYELSDGGRATRVVGEASVVQTEAESAWMNGSGIVFRPLVLTCSIDGAVHHAGVVALAARSIRRQRRELSGIIAAVAASLIRSGDTAGVTGD